jgi:hypothetical protein
MGVSLFRITANSLTTTPIHTAPRRVATSEFAPMRNEGSVDDSSVGARRVRS